MNGKRDLTNPKRCAILYNREEGSMTQILTKEYGKQIATIAGQLAIQGLTILAVIVLQDIMGELKHTKSKVKAPKDGSTDWMDCMGEDNFPKDGTMPRDRKRPPDEE